MSLSTAHANWTIHSPAPPSLDCLAEEEDTCVSYEEEDTLQEYQEE